MNILFIDPIFGISGDMMISAFLDAGMPFEELYDFLKKIPVDMPTMKPVKKHQGIIEGIHLEIAESKTHLSIIQMEHLIEGLNADPKIKDDAKGILDVLVTAEAKVHGVPRDDVHFHELSHIDTLIDVISVAKGMHFFGIKKACCGPIPMGRGTIKISHGIVPNPPPATAEILTGYNLRFLDTTLELTTPTGAAIVRYYVNDMHETPSFALQKIGYGLGSYDLETPDVLRIFIGKSEDPSHDEEVWLLEVDLDDMDMEYLGVVAERIRSRGALDVLYFPVYMKKGRIGVRLSITAPVEALQILIDSVLAETTTFGVRMQKFQRRVLRREEKIVDTSLGPVRIKSGYDREGCLVKTHIEFDDVKKKADEKGLAYQSTLEIIKSELIL
ncbi:MAG: nickel pincer cofactor biosynthesis protein LarC [Syntrophorhabdus sp.]